MSKLPTIKSIVEAARSGAFNKLTPDDRVDWQNAAEDALIGKIGNFTIILSSDRVDAFDNNTHDFFYTSHRSGRWINLQTGKPIVTHKSSILGRLEADLGRMFSK